MPRRFLLLGFGLFLAFLALLPWHSVQAAPALQSCRPVWESYNVLLEIKPDGNLLVTEDWQMLLGGTCREGFATIPRNFTTGITVLGVSDGTRDYTQGSLNNPYHYSVLYANDYVDIIWSFPSAINAKERFILQYEVAGALRIRDDGDVLQWIAIPEDLGAAVDAARVTVQLPAGAEILTNPESIGVPTQWQMGEGNRSVVFTNDRPFYASGDGLGVRVVFTHGVVPSVSPPWQTAIERTEFYNANIRPLVNIGLALLGLGLAAVGPIGAYGLWLWRGRDPKVENVPEFITEPPSDLPPGLVGVLFDEQVDPRDLTATIMDLAARGRLEFESVEKQGAFGMTNIETVLRKVENPTDEKGLADFERDIHNAIMGRSKEKKLGSPLSESASNTLLKGYGHMYQELVNRGLFRGRPDKVRQTYGAIGVAILGGMAVISFILFGIVIDFTGAMIICPAIGFAGIGASILGVSRFMPARTKKGAQEVALWRAFYTYLKDIQKFTDIEGVPEQFEKYLPYAVAFGIERRFVNTFTKVQTVPVMMPGWYHMRPLSGQTTNLPSGQNRPTVNNMGGSGGMVGGLNSLGSSLVTSLNGLGSSMRTAPPSSSGSSGGGGTFRSGGGGFSSSGGGGSRGFR